MDKICLILIKPENMNNIIILYKNKKTEIVIGDFDDFKKLIHIKMQKNFLYYDKCIVNKKYINKLQFVDDNKTIIFTFDNGSIIECCFINNKLYDSQWLFLENYSKNDDLYNKINKLKEKMNSLEKQNIELKELITYIPDGKGFIEAKDDFNSIRG